MASIYLPHAGRSDYDALMNDSLVQSDGILIGLCGRVASVIVGGDFNLSAIPHLLTGPPEECSEPRDSDFEHSERFMNVFRRHKMEFVVPEAGFTPNCFPYRQNVMPSVLGYLAASTTLGKCIASVTIESEWHAATDHVPILLHLRQQTGEAPNRRRHRARRRRRWENELRKTPASSPPLRERQWRTMEDLEEKIAAAANKVGRTSVGHRRTPFDEQEKELRSARRKEQHRGSRLALQRCILTVRRFQKQWKYESELLKATQRSQNLSKLPRPKGLLLAGKFDLATRQQDFANHWIPIVRGEEDIEELQQELEALAQQSFPYSSTFSEVDAMHIFHRPKKSKATGADGVLAEYLGALSTDQRLRLICFAREVLGGTMSMPASWSVAVVSLIAKVLVPQSPSDYRPITVLPTMFKFVKRLWILESSSYLALRHRSSHGLRATYPRGTSLCV